MTKLLALYYEALNGFRWKSFRIIILSGTSGILEGVALTALMPLLNQNLASYGTSSIELFGKAYQIHDQQFSVFRIITVFCFLGVLSSWLKFMMESQLLRLRVSLERTYNERLSEAVIKANWTTFLTVRFGDISKGINIESRNLASGAVAVISMLGLMITALIFFIIGYGVSRNMTLMTLCFGALMWIVFRHVSASYGKDSARLSSVSSQINYDIQQLLGNLKFLRSTGLRAYVLAKMSASFQKYEKVFLSLSIYNHVMRFAFEIAGLVFVSGFIAFSASQAPAAMGRLLVFLVIFYRLAPRLAAIQDQYGNALNQQGWYHSWHKLFQNISEHPDNRAMQTTSVLPRFLEVIEARDISFGYSGKPVLKNINWTLRKGQCLAIVGESGSGKTTMIDLLTELLNPDEGQLLLDGTPFTQLNSQAWQQRIGLVMQNSPMFHASVIENIAWGDPNPNLEVIEEAARMAHAWDFISRLPEKFGTVLGDKGATFSVGECQRIALARALYRNPWLLILDEATNALDAESETIILETLEQLKSHVTLFMVAHRLNTVKFADEIIVLDQGEIVERGTYSELMARPAGRFHRLASLQGLLK
jgi:ABC-type multidrug transport system fused ATPase/permease subunit